MPLKLRIPAGEKFVINGTVLANVGDRAMYIEFRTGVQFMRGRDILEESDIKTPLDRAYYLLQEIYLNNDRSDTARREFQVAAARAYQSANDDLVQATILNVTPLVKDPDLFPAVAMLRDLRNACSGNSTAH